MNFKSLTSVLSVQLFPVAFSLALCACGGGDKTLGTPESEGDGGDSTSAGSGGSSASGGSDSTGGVSTGGATSGSGGVSTGGATSGSGGSSTGGSGSGGTSACAGECSAEPDANDSFDFDCNGTEELCADFPIAAADCKLGGQGCLGSGYLPSPRTGEGKNSYCGSTNYQFCELDTSVGCIKTVGTTVRAAECK